MPKKHWNFWIAKKEKRVWHEATKAEACLYLNRMDESKEHYEKAAQLAGLREKLSIHTNAYQAFMGLKGTADKKQPFLDFLHQQFLR